MNECHLKREHTKRKWIIRTQPSIFRGHSLVFGGVHDQTAKLPFWETDSTKWTWFFLGCCMVIWLTGWPRIFTDVYCLYIYTIIYHIYCIISWDAPTLVQVTTRRIIFCSLAIIGHWNPWWGGASQIISCSFCGTILDSVLSFFLITWRVGGVHHPPLHTPLRNKGWIAGLICGGVWYVRVGLVDQSSLITRLGPCVPPL